MAITAFGWLAAVAVGLALHRRVGRRLAGLAAALAVSVAALCGASPTGVRAVDAGWAITFVLVVSVAGLAARRSVVVPVVLAAGIYAAATASMAAVALGVSAALVAAGGVSAAAAGVWVSSASLLYLGPGPAFGSSAVVSALAAAAVVAAAWRSSGPLGRRAIVGAACGVTAVTMLAGTALLASRSAAEAGSEDIEVAIAAAEAGDIDAVSAKVGAAAANFRTARRRATGPLMTAARALPVVAQHVVATRETTTVATDTTAAAQRAIAAIGRTGLIGTGGLDAARVEDAIQPVAALERSVTNGRRVTARADSRWLVPPARAALGRVEQRLRRVEGSLQTAGQALRVLPHLLGVGTPTRYFIAVQNPTESRASGGILGNFAEVEVDDGRLAMSAFGRAEPDLNAAAVAAGAEPQTSSDFAARYIRDTHLAWQNVTASPDFPTVGAVIADFYPKSGGRRVDAVISVDPTALAGLLQITGPVVVPGFTEPLSSKNAEQVLLRDQYAVFADDKEARVEYLGLAARAVFDALAAQRLPSLGKLSRALGPAVAAGHIRMWSTDRDVQRLLERLDLDGSFPRPRADLLAFVSQNASANKIDVYLHRTIDYSAAVDSATGQMTAEATITLRNDAPAFGAPAYVIESGVRPALSAPGENRLYVSFYSPFELVSAEFGGVAIEFQRQHELGLNVFSAFVTIPSRSSRVLTARFRGSIRQGRYALEVFAQPTVNADRGRITALVDGRRAVDIRTPAPDGRN